jgi:hypothetical protein
MYRKSLGRISPEAAVKINIAAVAIYGLNYLAFFDTNAKRLFTVQTGPVSRIVAKLIVLVSAANAAILYLLKNMVKLSDIAMAKVALRITAAFFLYEVYGHVIGTLKAFDSLLLTGFLTFLNAYIGYA